MPWAVCLPAISRTVRVGRDPSQPSTVRCDSNFRGDRKVPNKRKSPSTVECAGAFGCLAPPSRGASQLSGRAAIRPRAANKSVAGATYPCASRYHAAMIRPARATMANTMFLVFFAASKLYRSTQPLQSRMLRARRLRVCASR